ncbi:MAG: NmrA family NAD(P)-binding protein [Roseiflexaceae bacterium]|nr:NmrA family NAD(P)-binding protein [Roseiflexaceae bacterium]
MNVLVYGATGSQASPTVWKLLERGHQPYVLTRHPERAAAMREAGAQIVVGDMADPASLRAASEGMDAVALMVPFFLENPMNGPQYGRNAIDAARAAGVKLVVYNTSGPTPPERVGEPGMDLRVETIEYLRASELPHIVIAPTGYMENFLGPWTAPNIVQRDQLTYPNSAETRIGWIASEDVGALVAAAIERPELANAVFMVSGIENASGAELASAFSEGLGREIAYVAMEPEEFGAVLDQAFGPGAGDAASAQYRKMRDDPNPPAMWFAMQPVLDKLPVHMTSLAEWAAKHRAAFETRR